MAATAGLPSPSHSRPFTRTRRSEDYLWARAVVQTRSFYLGAERILLPGADLLNHDPAAPVVELRENGDFYEVARATERN